MTTLKLHATHVATAYHLRSDEPLGGWAIATVNDATGELSIQSDWGAWSYRWDPDPKALGFPTLTDFLRERRSVHYVHDKLHYGRTRKRFSPEKTVEALRQLMLAKHGPEDLWVDADGSLHEVWERLDDLADCESEELFLERMPALVHELITGEPFNHLVFEEPHSSRILRETILPALFEALRR